jgi:hypothetical protein
MPTQVKDIPKQYIRDALSDIASQEGIPAGHRARDRFIKFGTKFWFGNPNKSFDPSYAAGWAHRYAVGSEYFHADSSTAALMKKIDGSYGIQPTKVGPNGKLCQVHDVYISLRGAELAKKRYEEEGRYTFIYPYKAPKEDQWAVYYQMTAKQISERRKLIKKYSKR